MGKSRITKWTTAACTVAVLTLGAGCASVQDLDALRADIEGLKSATASAAADAEAARTEAGQASRTANRSLSAAREAQTCCTANSERIERMFKDAMTK